LRLSLRRRGRDGVAMRANLLDVIRCPACGGRVSCQSYKAVGLEIIDGILSCACGRAYPVIGGVARLLTTVTLPGSFRAQYATRLASDAPSLATAPAAEADAFSFSFQWGRHAYDELTWELLLSERLELFLRYYGAHSFEELRGLCVLDAGCGNGTLSAQLAASGLEVVAMDYSESVYRAFSHAMLDASVPEAAIGRLGYVQADVWFPPFGQGTYDLVYSDGVLHHTADTKTAFVALASMVKPGGRFLVWLYRRDVRPGIWVKNQVVEMVHRLTRRWPHRAKMWLCTAGAVVLVSLVRLARPFGYHRRRAIPIRLKALNLFDTIAPTYNHKHTPTEVMDWFHEVGFVNVRDASIRDHRLDEGGFAVIGTRPL
jgi:2-polyprenyl-3-methyl-5-hydroxy-6-metoxy-1,4-benzoquinol methylase/uncharacterized protein YbaR (Trm112 family)